MHCCISGSVATAVAAAAAAASAMLHQYHLCLPADTCHTSGAMHLPDATAAVTVAAAPHRCWRAQLR
jgi:hypothetical protein